LCSRRFGHRSRPDLAINARCSLASVFRHSFHGQQFAAERASQQSLQGLHFAPPAFSCCLGDTGLESFNLRLDLVPVLGPGRYEVRRRTSARRCLRIGCEHCHLLPPVQRLIRLFRHGRPCGSLLAFAPDDLSICIHPITG